MEQYSKEFSGNESFCPSILKLYAKSFGNTMLHGLFVSVKRSEEIRLWILAGYDRILLVEFSEKRSYLESQEGWSDLLSALMSSPFMSHSCLSYFLEWFLSLKAFQKVQPSHRTRFGDYTFFHPCLPLLCSASVELTLLLKATLWSSCLSQTTFVNATT